MHVLIEVESVYGVHNDRNAGQSRRNLAKQASFRRMRVNDREVFAAYDPVETPERDQISERSQVARHWH